MDGLGLFYDWAGNQAEGAALFMAVGDNPAFALNPPSRKSAGACPGLGRQLRSTGRP